VWRVVLDTSILVAALRSRRGASSALLGLVADRTVTPLVTTALLLEYEDVLKRPEQLTAMGTTTGSIDGFLSALAAGSEAVESHYRWRPQTRDPGDDMVLEAAINGLASALITHNVRHFADAGVRFGISVLRPADALRKFRP
jgi:putative PIN family toxin of toxin-antitoxin system